MTESKWPLKVLKYVVLGCLALALITEISLRVMGMSGKLAGTALGYSKPAGARLVLCEGGSMVWGVDGHSFPLQLQAQLDKKGKGRFVVLNRGVPGANFVQTFNRIKEDIHKYRPDFLLYVPPNNDYWNKSGSSQERLESRLLRHLYLYRLYGYLTRRQAPPPEQVSELLSDGSVFDTLGNSVLNKSEQAWTMPVIGKASGSAMSALMLTFSAQALQAGQPGVALQSAREALRLDPENEAASVAVLRALSASGSCGKAADMAAQLCMEHPASVEVLSASGYAFLKDGQPDKAVQLLYRAEALGGQDRTLFEHGAMAWLQKGNYYEAGATALRGLKRYPDSARLKELLLQAYLSGGKLKQALTVLKSGGNERLHRVFFEELAQSGDMRAALYGASLFARKGERDAIYADMAAALVRAQDASSALEALEAAHKRGFSDWHYHVYKAALLHKLCRWDDATFHVAKAIELQPQAWFPRFVAGSIAAYAGNPRAALKLLSKAQALSPGSPAPAHLKARILWRQGRREEALAAYEQALAAAPADTAIFREYAESAVQAGGLKRVAGLAASMPEVGYNTAWRELVKGERPVLPEGVLPGQDAVLARNIAAIKNLCRRYGIALLAGAYPGIEFMQPRRAAEEAGVDYIDVPALLAARFHAGGDYLALDGSHFNAAGNRVMAEAFASALESASGAK